MSNVEEYKNLSAFHPGYYISELIEDMEMTQGELAKRLDTSPVTISKIINGNMSLSDEMMIKLSIMFGISIKTWMNLQKSYDEKIAEIEKEKRIDGDISVLSQIDYTYFEKIGAVPKEKKALNRITNLCVFFKISSLSILKKKEFLTNFRTAIPNPTEKNIINANAWLQTAQSISYSMQTKPFDEQYLRDHIDEIRNMTVQNIAVSYPRLCEIFNNAGVKFILLPPLKCCGINGAVKWINSETVILAMNNRGLSADKFWFSLLHEIEHVLQKKVTITFLATDGNIDDEFERKADEFAQNKLIPKKAYYDFLESGRYTEDSIMLFANEQNVHPGIVVGRLQRDGYIQYYQFNNLKEKYLIDLKKKIE